MALEDIDDWLFKWASQCEPTREKCIICDNTDCQWWGDFNEDENPCEGCSNYQKVEFNNKEVTICRGGVNNPDKCVLNKKEDK